jgi:hypothetical protein
MTEWLAEWVREARVLGAPAYVLLGAVACCLLAAMLMRKRV